MCKSSLQSFPCLFDYFCFLTEKCPYLFSTAVLEALTVTVESGSSRHRFWPPTRLFRKKDFSSNSGFRFSTPGSESTSGFRFSLPGSNFPKNIFRTNFRIFDFQNSEFQIPSDVTSKIPRQNSGIPNSVLRHVRDFRRRLIGLEIWSRHVRSPQRSHYIVTMTFRTSTWTELERSLTWTSTKIYRTQTKPNRAHEIAIRGSCGTSCYVRNFWPLIQGRLATMAKPKFK